MYHSNGLKYKDFSLPGATPFYKEKAKTVTSVLKKSNSALKNTILALGQLAVSPFSPAKDGDDDEYECESCDDRTDVSTKSTARSSSRSDISIRTEGSLDFFSHGNSTESLSSMSSTSSTSSSACTSTCHTARDGNTHNSSNNNDGCNANTNCTSSSKFNKKAPGMKDFIVEECSTGEGYEVDSVDSVLSNRPHSPFGTGLYDNPHYDVCKQYGSMIDTGACVINVDQKVLHYAWHPHENTIAVAGKVGLYLYKL